MLRVSDEPQPRVFSVDDVEPKVGVMGMCVYVYMLRVPRVYTRDTMGLRVLLLGLRVSMGP